MKLILTFLTSFLLFCPKSHVNMRIERLNKHMPRSVTDSDLHKSASINNSYLNFSSDQPSFARHALRANSPERGCFHFVLAPLRYLKNKF